MGCSIGWRLAQAGCDVTLIEKAVPGAEASSAAAGILGSQSECAGPGAFLDLCLASRGLWREFAAELRDLTDVDVGYRESGLLEIAEHSQDIEPLLHRETWMLAQNLRAQWLSPQQVHELEPQTANSIAGALWLADDAQVDPAQLSRALAAAAARAGARFVSGTTVLGLRSENGCVAHVRTNAGDFSADVVVAAAGAWTDLLPDLPPLRTSVRPVHGQLVMLDARPPILTRTLCTRGGYVVPRADGRVVVGATTDDFGYNKSVTAEGLHHLLDLAIRLVPALGAAQVVQHWSGLRPHGGDNLPLIGEHPQMGGLFVASGHYRNGILLTPITALAMTQTILRRPLVVDLGPFAP